jgi:hypothetical protein
LNFNKTGILREKLTRPDRGRAKKIEDEDGWKSNPLNPPYQGDFRSLQREQFHRLQAAGTAQASCSPLIKEQSRLGVAHTPFTHSIECRSSRAHHHSSRNFKEASLGQAKPKEKSNPLNPPYQGDFRSLQRKPFHRLQAAGTAQASCSPLTRGARGVGFDSPPLTQKRLDEGL